MLILEIKGKPETTFWNHLTKNQYLQAKDLLTTMSKGSYYKILNKINKIQNQLGIKLLKTTYTSTGGKILERVLTPTIKQNYVHLK